MSGRPFKSILLTTKINDQTPNQTHPDSQRSAIKSEKINELYSKFHNLNTNVSIDHDLSSFNFIQYDSKGLKMEYDEQMLTSKLKRLQNNAELKRIDMELQRRKNKFHKNKNSNLEKYAEVSYLTIYKEIAQNSTLKASKHEHQSDSDQEVQKNEVQKEDGILYYSELKKHPKILEYTIQKVRSKDKLKKQFENSRIEQFQSFKNQIKTISFNESQKKKNNKNQKKVENQRENPQKIVDSIFRKIYTKKNRNNPIEQIKNDERVNQFLVKQDSIIYNSNQKRLSKENYKKLKQKFHLLANQMYVVDKKHVSKQKKGEMEQKLPKIKMNNSSMMFY